MLKSLVIKIQALKQDKPANPWRERLCSDAAVQSVAADGK